MSTPCDAPVLFVVESFVSLQGEGFHTGTRALFIRLAGCNATTERLECSDWCDTKYAWHPQHATVPETALTFDDIERLLDSALSSERPELLIFTGGEPLLQHRALQAFFEQCTSWRRFSKVCFETNGTLSRDLVPSAGKLWFTVSPKGPMFRLGPGPLAEVKLVVTQSMMESVPRTVALLQGLTGSGRHHFVQPLDNNLEVAEWVAKAVLRECPGWRLNLQLHKVLRLA